MKAQISINVEVQNKEEAHKVKQSFETMNTHFKAKGIIKMQQLFLKDAFIRNLVKMKINKG